MNRIYLLRLISYYLLFTTITKADTCSDPTCTNCLDQTSFSGGTLQITTSGKYCLSEDIIFNPNPPDITAPNDPYSSSFPLDANTYPGCTSLSGGAFALGYFAAITIEANDVELDLKGYEIKMDSAFYIQQRSFSIIEIGSSPFTSGSGPTDFGINTAVQNIIIHNGSIGLSSHSGIHSNEANNVIIENLRIYDFETAGIQMNDFNGLTLNALIIGPSSDAVKPCAYYSSAKYLSYALYNLIENEPTDINASIAFSGDRIELLQDIYDDLITSLDIAYRWFIGESTELDLVHRLRNISISLYSNPMQLPDGAVISGIALKDGSAVSASNVKIMDLELNNNEIPAAYFSSCSIGEEEVTVLQGPFGDAMDIRQMVGGWNNALTIDLGDDFTELSYVGNPLSDAQIALALFASNVSSSHGTDGQNAEFLKWALDEYEGESYDGLPECTQFVCNGDMMFHANKGVIGMRLNEIEDAEMQNIVIKRLINKSPLASYACSNHSGAPVMDVRLGGIGTDTKGVAVIGGELIFDGFNNVIEKLVSYNGDVVGLHVKKDANVLFEYVFEDELPSTEDADTEDDRSAIHIKQLCPAHEITFGLLAELMVDGQYPFPNNFYACNILIDNDAIGAVTPHPPNGVEHVWCADYVPSDADENIANVFGVGVFIEDDEEEEESESETTQTATTLNAPGETLPMFPAHQAMNDILQRNAMVDNLQSLAKKYPNAPYVYFFIGVMCIIMVVFVLVTFIMKCGKMMVKGHKKYNQAYSSDTDVDFDGISESEATDDEEI